MYSDVKSGGDNCIHTDDNCIHWLADPPTDVCFEYERGTSHHESAGDFGLVLEHGPLLSR